MNPDVDGSELSGSADDLQTANRRQAERAGFERARLENLFHFASLTPEQRVQWLVDVLEIMAEVQRPRIAGS